MKKDRVRVVYEKGEVFVDGKEVRFSPKEMGVLNTIKSADGFIVSREELISKIWGPDFIDIPSRTVDQHVARVRRKLGKCGAAIRTVTSRGYRYVGV